MRKFAVLFNTGLWNHGIVGYADGSWELIRNLKNRDENWITKYLDKTIKVIRAEKVEGKDMDFAFYTSKNIKTNPKPSLKELKTFEEGSTAFDISFKADYLSEEKIWIVLGNKPNVDLSIQSI